MDTLNIVLSVPAVIALVQIIKGWLPDKVAGKYATAVAIGVGVGLNVGDYYLSTYGAWQAGLQGVIVALAASGVYVAAQTASTTITNEHTTLV